MAVILNPRSATGRTARQWPTLEAQLRARCPRLEVLRTEGPGDATRLAREALRQGFERIISAGGDGTNFEVVNGFFEDGKPINPEAVLALLPCGTGSDFAKTLRLARGAAAVETACVEAVFQCDVGCIRHATAEGGKGTSYFLNTCHIGTGSEVAVQVNASAKRLGGFLAFLYGTLKALCIYKDKKMRISVDGVAVEQCVKELILAKGQFDGGGMNVAPFARLDSGLFEVYIVSEISLGAVLLRLPKLYRGKLHECVDYVQYHRARVVEVQCEERVAISPDGELRGILPARFEVLPQALWIAGVPAQVLSKQVMD